MSTADTYVRARIDTATKKRAADALEAMGLSIADAMQTKYDLWQAETKQHNVLMGMHRIDKPGYHITTGRG